MHGYTPGYKALLPIAGRPSIDYTLEALWGTPQVRSICIVGAQAELQAAVGAVPARGPVEFIAGGETLLESILHGLLHFREAAMVLVTTSDLPLLTSGAVTDFLGACQKVETPWEHSAFLAVVPEHCYHGAYSHFTKPFNCYRDVSICHGNLALVDPKVVENKTAMGRLNRLYQARKNPVTSALAVGLGVGLCYVIGVHLFHALTLMQFSRIVSRHFRMGLIPVLLEHPEVSIDVDEPEDYRFVRELLGAP